MGANFMFVGRGAADPVRVGQELLDAAGIERGGSNPWDIQVHDDRVFERALRDRELGLGESYMDGWWDAEALDEFLVKVLLADLRAHIKSNPEVLWLAAKAKLANRQSLRRAKANASAHYDTGNDLFERMLDRRMIYSCAYWREAGDLDAAQEAKLDLICRKLQLEPGMSLLDIGCGWGGFAAFAAERYGVSVTGVSPAIEQVKVARERCRDLDVRIEQLDYRDVTGSFDRIVSVGMMEHVGPKNFGEFFQKCRELLRPDGLMLHHTIGANHDNTHTDPWYDTYIFPGGVVPSLAQIATGARERWAIEDVHNFGPDYDRTLQAWSANIEARWAEIPSYDERFRRMWHYYLMSSAASFRVRNLQLWQVVFSPASVVSPRFDTVR